MKYIIMINVAQNVFTHCTFPQIENEYGANDLGPCDKGYILWLKNLIEHYLGDNVPYFSNENCDVEYMRCGHIPDVLTTVDFNAVNNSKFIYIIYVVLFL